MPMTLQTPASATTSSDLHPPRPHSSLAAPEGFSRWDYLGMLTGFVLTLAITVINSRGRVFWEDEMLGWMLLRDPSWHHMIHAWNLGADGGGFSFYLLCRGWFALVGASVLKFRLFSGVCFGLGFVALWAGLRRVYPTWVVAFAAFNSVFFSPPLIMHFIEGRFYGLLFLCVALAMGLALTLDDTPDPTPARLYVAAFLIHGVLTTSHVLGVVFSAFLLLGTIVLDLLAHRRRLGLYFTVAAAWLLLLPEKTSIAAAGRVGKPHFWTRAPNLHEVVGGFTGYSREILLVLVLLAVLAGWALWRAPGGFAAALRETIRARCAAYVMTLCLFLVPCAFLVEGLLGTWLFNSRYLQPVAVGVAYLTAELLGIATSRTWLPESLHRRPVLLTGGRTVAATLFAAFTFFWVFHHVAEYTPEFRDYTGDLTARLPHDVPVVVEDAFTFTNLISRQANSGVHYVFLLDWPYAVAPGSPRLEVTQYHLMENWKLAGYFPDNIEDSASFLRTHPRFLTIHDDVPVPDPTTQPEIGNPIAERLAHTPGYEVRPYFTLDRKDKATLRDTVRLVCRGGCGPA